MWDLEALAEEWPVRFEEVWGGVGGSSSKGDFSRIPGGIDSL